MSLRLEKSLIFLVFCMVYGVAMPVRMACAGGQVPVVSGQVIRDFARITFEWPTPTYLSATAHGNVIIVTFDRRANPDTARMLRQLRPYVSTASVMEGGKTMRLKLNRPYRIRSFVSGAVSGIDILNIHSAPSVSADINDFKQSTVSIAGEKQTKQHTKKEAKKQQLAARPQNSVILQASSADKLSGLEPAAGIESAEGADAKPPVIREGMTDAEAAAVIAGAKGGKSDTKVVITADSSENAASGTFKPMASRGEALFEIVFPWKERAAAAAFIRNHDIWVVFGRSTAMDTTSISSQLAPRRGEVRQLSIPGASVLIIPMEDYIGAELHTEPGSFAWKLVLSPQKRDSENPLLVKINTESDKAHAYIPALEASEPVAVRDPDVGDELIVVPLFGDNQSVADKRSFVDFTLLSSVQGIAVEKVSDDAIVTLVRNGVRIATEKGAHFSANLPTREGKKISRSGADKNTTLFPYEEWKAPDGVSLTEQVQMLQQRRLDVSSPIEKNNVRLKLAKYYLSIGLSVEAYGILQEIKRLEPSFYTSNHLNAYAGAALFLMYRFSEAGEALNAAELNDLPEITYWRNMISELLGNSDQVFDYLANDEKYIRHYPPLFRQRLAVISADRAVGKKDYPNALKILDSLNKEGLTGDITEYVNYLMGKISVETGQIKDGMELWRKLVESPRNSPVCARAQFSLIAMQLKMREITKEDAIEKLERLALTWRGDTLELTYLDLLGDLYKEKKDWANAMRVWSSMNTLFRNTEIATNANRKLNETFVALFSGAEKSNMSTFDKLVLYNKYRDLTPSDETGDQIVEKLADEMIALDLLEQTATMLEQRMQFKYEREQRSKVGAKLARVYLMNHQPELALKALQNSVYGNNPESLQNERNYLTVRSMIALKDYDRALRMIADDKSIEAQNLRLEINWQHKNWPQVASTIESMLKTRSDPAAKLNNEESDWVVQLALAYVAVGDSVQLKYLRDYFLPLIGENADKGIFEFVTREDAALDEKNFDKVMQIYNDTRQFLAGYETHKM